MIKAFQHYLSAALSRSARPVDANRRRLPTFGAGALGAAVMVPVLATPSPVVARPPVATRKMLGDRETDHTRHYYATARH
jgi:hypothetical protein